MSSSIVDHFEIRGVDPYEILGLDPDQPWDKARFDAVLKEKLAKWRSPAGTVNPKSKEYVGLASKMREAFADPSIREVLAERAKQRRGQKKVKKAAELERRIRWYAVRGFVLEAEVDTLLNDYGPTLGEAAVREQLSTLTVRQPEHAAREPEPLDSTVAKGIRESLSRLEVLTGQPTRNLYEFLLRHAHTFLVEADIAAGGLTNDRILEMAARQPAEKLKAAANNLSGHWQLSTKKTELLPTLVIELTGHCMVQFDTEESRARYDITLKQERFQRILDDAQHQAKHTRLLSIEEVQLLIEDASRPGSDGPGLNPAETLAVLRRYAQAGHFAMATVPDVSTQARCACGELNPGAKPTDCCRACGEPLTVACPKCQRATPSDQQACSGCGFALGQRFLVRALLEEAHALLKAGHTRDAVTQVDEAAAEWPSTGDTLAMDIAAVRAVIAKTAAASARKVDEVKAQIAAKAYYAARRVLDTIDTGSDDDHLQQVRAQVARAIADVEGRFAALRLRSASPEQIVRDCLLILQMCADCEPARQLLAQHPPGAPEQLRAVVTGQVVALRWSASRSTDVRYIVVRQAGVRPQSPASGCRVATVNDLRYDDIAPESGVDLHYAVFADRGGIVSKAAAWLDAPVLVPADVTGLHVVLGDGEIQLEWAPPSAVHRIVVTRIGAQASGNTPVQLASLDLKSAVDKAVINGEQYRYRVQCEFRRLSGELVQSPGVEATAVAQRRPAPAGALTFTPGTESPRQTLIIGCPSVERGELWILATAATPQGAGQALPLALLRGLGDMHAARPRLTLPWVPGEVRYYTPTIVLGETAYLGDACRFVHLDDVERLTPQNLGGQIRLTWAWPPNCTLAEVATAPGAWPIDEMGRALPKASRVMLSRTQYDLKGWYDVRCDGTEDLFVVVRAAVSSGGENLLSSGTRRQVRVRSQVRLEYELKHRLFGGIDLVIATDKATELPAFRLNCREGMLPEHRDDGECVFRQSAKLEIKGKVKIPLSAASRRGTFGKLFLDDNGDYEWITVFHPERSKLRM